MLANRIKHDWRSFCAFGYDLACVGLLWVAGLHLRYELSPVAVSDGLLLGTTPLVVLVYAACFVSMGLYQGLWRFASLHDLHRIYRAILIGALAAPLLLLLVQRLAGVPRSLFFLHPALLLLLMTGARLGVRWWKEQRPYHFLRLQGKPLLILGAGDRARRLVDELTRSSVWFAVGLLGEDRAKVGRRISNVQILGVWHDLADVVDATGARHAILAVDVDDHHVRRRAFESCEAAGIHLMMLPAVDELISDAVPQAPALREVELDDLLGRDPVELDAAGLRHWIVGRTVLVTGAGGSIGSELCRQLARFAPRDIVLVDHDEFAMYAILEWFATHRPEQSVRPRIGDVKDAARMATVFGEFRPSIVFHAAAYKHVPMMEEGNSAQAVANNVAGTMVVADMCMRHDVERMVFVSTDKAVNPTNVMGATKRLSEMLLQHLHARDHLPVVMVRFGNVLGSTGSVIPKFKEQIARGGPVTVTHPDMTRYFMSIPEAAQLVLQAGLMGKGGEVFVLDMGEPVRIVDLARDLIRLSGAGEDRIRIEFSGLRPGEKLFEELLASDETSLATPHPKLRVQRAMTPPGPGWNQRTTEWLSRASGLDDDAVRAGLQELVPEYRPATHGRSQGADASAVQAAP